MQLEFAKMNGLGNDFVVIEDLDGTLDMSAEAVAWFCDRHFGIGADGLILVRRAVSPDADFAMHYFNADGSLAEMCGNGARCFAKYVVDHGLVAADASSLVIETLGGPRPVHFSRADDGTLDLATVDMGDPKLAPADIPTLLDGRSGLRVPDRDACGSAERHCCQHGQSARGHLGRRCRDRSGRDRSAPSSSSTSSSPKARTSSSRSS